MTPQEKKGGVPFVKILLWIALAATIGGALFATRALSSINKNIAAAKESARPANVKITVITAPDCADCFNVQNQVAGFKKQNISVGEETSISFESDQAKSLITQFNITRVPTYIVTGEVGKKNLETFVKSNGEIKNNTFIFTKAPPIFLDPATKKEFGKVTVSILTDASCPQCFNPKPIIESYKKAGIAITSTNEISWDSIEGQRIISQYKITKVPTFILSSDIDFYDNVKNSWAQISTIEQDKTYIVRNVPLPYRDLSKGQIMGLVDVIYLTDSSCSECYNAKQVHRPILTQGIGIGLRSERTVDASSVEGQALISKYKITKIPTVLLSPTVDEYTNLKSAWKDVGTVESDGWYIFRQIQVLGSLVYKDLSTNKVVKPAAPNPSSP